MKLIWKIVLIVSLLVILLGLAALGVGIFTGASPDRICEQVFGGREMLELIWQTLLSGLRETIPGSMP